MGNGVGMGKVPLTGNSRLQSRFYSCGDGDQDGNDFEGGDGNGKAIPDPAPPRCHL